MSTVWQTKHRLFLEPLQELAEWLSADGPRTPAILEEHLTRLLAVVVMLLRQHQVNKRGQCRFCGWTRWKWRFWHRRRRCTVHQAADLAMNQDLDVVWWCVFDGVERKLGLAEVRAWLTERAANTSAAISTENSQSDDENPTIAPENNDDGRG